MKFLRKLKMGRDKTEASFVQPTTEDTCAMEPPQALVFVPVRNYLDTPDPVAGKYADMLRNLRQNKPIRIVACTFGLLDEEHHHKMLKNAGVDEVLFGPQSFGVNALNVSHGIVGENGLFVQNKMIPRSEYPCEKTSMYQYAVAEAGLTPKQCFVLDADKPKISFPEISGFNVVEDLETLAKSLSNSLPLAMRPN